MYRYVFFVHGIISHYYVIILYYSWLLIIPDLFCNSYYCYLLFVYMIRMLLRKTIRFFSFVFWLKIFFNYVSKTVGSQFIIFMFVGSPFYISFMEKFVQQLVGFSWLLDHYCLIIIRTKDNLGRRTYVLEEWRKKNYYYPRQVINIFPQNI